MSAGEAGAILTVNVIGAGRIGGPVRRFLASSPDWRLGMTLRRSGPEGNDATTDPDRFFRARCDLVLELAGPRALASFGERALGVADVWTVGAAALADARLARALAAAGRRAGTRLRLLPGAIAGLDGVAAAAEAARAAGGTTALSIQAVQVRPSGQPDAEGPLREVARDHPDALNFAVAAALAGPGLDAARVRLSSPARPGEHRLRLTADCPFGRMGAEVAFAPLAPDRLHPVAASVIAALRRERAVIWAG